MLELVVPSALDADAAADDRLSPLREMVGRRVYAIDGPFDAAQALAATLSEAGGGPPVLLNVVTDQTGDTRTVDVHMYRGGQHVSVSRGVEKPRPQDEGA